MVKFRQTCVWPLSVRLLTSSFSISPEISSQSYIPVSIHADQRSSRFVDIQKCTRGSRITFVAASQHTTPRRYSRRRNQGAIRMMSSRSNTVVKQPWYVRRASLVLHNITDSPSVSATGDMRSYRAIQRFEERGTTYLLKSIIVLSGHLSSSSWSLRRSPQLVNPKISGSASQAFCVPSSQHRCISAIQASQTGVVCRFVPYLVSNTSIGLQNPTLLNTCSTEFARHCFSVVHPAFPHGVPKKTTRSVSVSARQMRFDRDRMIARLFASLSSM